MVQNLWTGKVFLSKKLTPLDEGAKALNQGPEGGRPGNGGEGYVG